MADTGAPSVGLCCPNRARSARRDTLHGMYDSRVWGPDLCLRIRCLDVREKGKGNGSATGGLLSSAQQVGSVRLTRKWIDRVRDGVYRKRRSPNNDVARPCFMTLGACIQGLSRSPPVWLVSAQSTCSARGNTLSLRGGAAKDPCMSRVFAGLLVSADASSDVPAPSPLPQRDSEELGEPDENVAPAGGPSVLPSSSADFDCEPF